MRDAVEHSHISKYLASARFVAFGQTSDVRNAATRTAQKSSSIMVINVLGAALTYHSLVQAVWVRLVLLGVCLG
jgi:hypothetical protein